MQINLVYSHNNQNLLCCSDFFAEVLKKKRSLPVTGMALSIRALTLTKPKLPAQYRNRLSVMYPNVYYRKDGAQSGMHEFSFCLSVLDDAVKEVIKDARKTGKKFDEI